MVEEALPERERLLAETVARLRDDVERLRDAAWTRSVVDVAKGVLIGRLGCDVDEAFEYLMDLSTSSGRGLIEVSASLLDLSAGIEATPHAPSTEEAPPAVPAKRAQPPRAPSPPDLSTYAGAVAAFDGAADIDELAGLLCQATSADGVLFGVTTERGEPRIVAAAGMPARTAAEWLRGRPTPGEDPVVVSASGEPLWRPRAVWLPIRAEERVVGVTGLTFSAPREWTSAARRRIEPVATAAGRRMLALLTDDDVDPARAAWIAGVQSMLDVLPGSVALLTPIWGDNGDLVDLRHDAASQGAVDVAGRRHAEMRGRRILEVYPTIAGTELWQAYRRVLDSGQPETIGPFDYDEVIAGVPRTSQFNVRMSRLGAALLVAWERLDTAERAASIQAQIQRMGRIGWGLWNLVTGESEWSEQLYRILDRDPADGPMTVERFYEVVHPEDVTDVRTALEALVDRGEPFDVECRVEAGGETRHLRIIAEITRDATGRPVEMHGLVQDISTLRQARQRLEVIRRELVAHQQLLAEEHRLAVQLQRIILPVPDAPLDLPGMRVAVRYVPAERLTHVGGDWFQANELADGSLLLAVGDVAGHGLAAAATMAQLRHALAGLSMITREPADILAALNDLLCGQPDYDSLLATAVVARYSPGDRTLTWAQAGHPPALLARIDSATPLPRPEGVLLGASHRARYEQASERLQPGDLLLMYTDGLIEAPGVSLDDGLAALTHNVTQTLRDGHRDPLTATIRRLRRANRADDTCILAAQLT